MFFPHRYISKPKVFIHHPRRKPDKARIGVELAGTRVLMTADEAIALTNQLADTIERLDQEKTQGQENQDA